MKTLKQYVHKRDKVTKTRGYKIILRPCDLATINIRYYIDMLSYTK